MSCCSRDVVAKSMTPLLERSRHRLKACDAVSTLCLHHSLRDFGVGNAPVAIIDRQLPFEYTIASRSTDVMVPISPDPPIDSTDQVLTQWNAVYDVHNEVACLMLGKEGKSVRYIVLRSKGICGAYWNFLLRKGLPKKAATPQVMEIQGGRIQKANKKSLNAKGKGKGKGKGKDKSYILSLKALNLYAKEHRQKVDCLPKTTQRGNGNRAQVEAIRSDALVLPNGLLTPPYTPQHNRVFEKRNHTLLDMVRSIMNLTTLSLSFWDYALESATRTLNMVSTKKVDKTPYKFWYGKVPYLSYLKILRDVIGYPKEMMGYYFYFPPENKIVVVMYVEFLEKNLLSQEVSGRAEKLEEIQDKDTSPSENTSKNPMEVEEVEEHSLGDFNEPNNYKAAILDPESVAKGYTQTYGVDYKETFSPVADIRAIRILIAIAAFYDYKIWQMDVKTAFLNGYLNEDIYMVQPKGFVDPNHPRKASGNNVTFLILYVDDIIIMGNHISSLQSVKSYLGKCFAMKDLGEATFILGIKIYRDRSKRLIGLSQSAYMDKILKRFRMDTSKRGYIPMQERLALNKIQGASTPEEVKHMKNVPYSSAVGSIMYVVRCTRPEIDRDDIKSQTGYVFVLNGGAVDWKSSKQSTTEMSTTEVEYIASSKAAMEAV
ncbi:retrotransposon protein, putative, ty1-copia subclass [Tanacetum coccineum]|uniref:Retrotransposon protein, putative, ty1-copia subclass n=1 Tax=Tanacetum coccineum TaxID=301880 RepID=A0ABQ5BZB3_9ASTR